MDKRTLFQLYWIWLLAFLLLIGILWIADKPIDAVGVLHPEFGSMLKSGASVATIPLIKWLAYLFGLGIVGIFIFSLFVGAWKAKPEVRNKIFPWFWGGTVLYLLTFSIMVFAYWTDVATTEDQYLLGFPLPTTLMLLVFGFSPLFFSILYINNFSRWILSPEEQKTFNQIVERRRQRESHSSPKSNEATTTNGS